jgi:hypothetical protein
LFKNLDLLLREGFKPFPFKTVTLCFLDIDTKSINILYHYLQLSLYNISYYLMIQKGLNLCKAFVKPNRFMFANDVQTNVKADTSAKNLTYYKNGQLTTRTQITLKKTEDVEAYVIKTIQNYFRSTYKQGKIK